MNEQDEGELDLEIVGQKVRTKGYRLIDLIWLPMMFGIAYLCLAIYQHTAFAQNTRDSVAKQLTESNQAIAAALRESNKATIDAIKEANSNTLQAIQGLTTEQRKTTTSMRESVCLQDPLMKNRGDAKDFCKRMATGDR